MSKDGNHSMVGEQPPALVRAIKLILRPMVKFLIGRGITFPVFSQWLKSIFVDVAVKDFSLPDKAQTDSRINLLTGIHRKDVKRLRSEAKEDSPAPRAVSLGALLVARWSGLKQYLDDKGEPLPLPRQSETEGAPSFEQLVVEVNKDIRPRVVLDEWLRLGIVHLDDDNKIHLDTAAFIPQKGLDELAYYFGRNLRDHMSAAVNNLSEEEKRFLERSVYYDKLSPEAVEQLEALAREKGMEVLQTVNRRAMELQEQSKNRQPDAGEEPWSRMNFGVYFFSDEDCAEEEKEH